MEKFRGEKILTVIVPSYNMESYLEKCLKSLIVPSDLLEKLEIIVVNDGSTDHTSEIAWSFQENYNATFVVLDKKNGHYGSCINVALEIAKGKYVKIVDADDSYQNSNFVKLLKCLCKINDAGINEIDLIVNDYVTVDEKGKVIKKYKFDLIKNEIAEVSKLEELYGIEMHAITYRTELLKKIYYKQTEGILYTDQEWVYIPMMYIKRYMYLDFTVYLYLIGRNGQSMDPKVECKNLWMNCLVKKNIISNYVKLGKKDEHAKLLLKKLPNIYASYLIKYWKTANLNELKDLDDYLKKSDENLYKEVGNSRLNRFIGLRYIMHWRMESKLLFLDRILEEMYWLMIKIIKR